MVAMVVVVVGMRERERGGARFFGNVGCVIRFHIIRWQVVLVKIVIGFYGSIGTKTEKFIEL